MELLTLPNAIARFPGRIVATVAHILTRDTDWRRSEPSRTAPAPGPKCPTLAIAYAVGRLRDHPGQAEMCSPRVRYLNADVCALCTLKRD